MRFFIADAFTDALFGGNPAGIVLLEEQEAYPPEERMRKTAAELRYSETAFVKRMSQTEFQLRYFTPAAEVDLCGHATIATFTALLGNGMVRDGGCYQIHTLSGILSVHIQDGLIMMEMAPAKRLRSIDNPETLQELYGVMGLSYAPSLSPEGNELFPMIISTGLPDILLPVADAQSLASISPDFPALAILSTQYEVVGVHAFALEGNDWAIDARCRNFAPLYGINEEAATGTSNGALTEYLYGHGLISPGKTCCFLQGEAMGRTSKIYTLLEAECARIKVGGTGVILASGVIHL